MMRLQLRTPCNTTLDLLVSQLTFRILESVKRELDSMEVPFQSYRNLESSVVKALSPFLAAATSCGTHLICTEGIGAEPLPEVDDRIYMLDLPAALADRHVSDIVTRVLSITAYAIGIDGGLIPIDMQNYVP